ncbi:hypothetical protein D3C78_1406700 [compost metagenome]
MDAQALAAQRAELEAARAEAKQEAGAAAELRGELKAATGRVGVLIADLKKATADALEAREEAKMLSAKVAELQK